MENVRENKDTKKVALVDLNDFFIQGQTLSEDLYNLILGSFEPKYTQHIIEQMTVDAYCLKPDHFKRANGEIADGYTDLTAKEKQELKEYVLKDIKNKYNTSVQNLKFFLQYIKEEKLQNHKAECVYLFSPVQIFQKIETQLNIKKGELKKAYDATLENRKSEPNFKKSIQTLTDIIHVVTREVFNLQKNGDVILDLGDKASIRACNIERNKSVNSNFQDYFKFLALGRFGKRDLTEFKDTNNVLIKDVNWRDKKDEFIRKNTKTTNDTTNNTNNINIQNNQKNIMTLSDILQIENVESYNFESGHVISSQNDNMMQQQEQEIHQSEILLGLYKEDNYKTIEVIAQSVQETIRGNFDVLHRLGILDNDGKVIHSEDQVNNGDTEKVNQEIQVDIDDFQKDVKNQEVQTSQEDKVKQITVSTQTKNTKQSKQTNTEPEKELKKEITTKNDTQGKKASLDPVYSNQNINQPEQINQDQSFETQLANAFDASMKRVMKKWNDTCNIEANKAKSDCFKHELYSCLRDNKLIDILRENFNTLLNRSHEKNLNFQQFVAMKFKQSTNGITPNSHLKDGRPKTFKEFSKRLMIKFKEDMNLEKDRYILNNLRVKNQNNLKI